STTTKSKRIHQRSQQGSTAPMTRKPKTVALDELDWGEIGDTICEIIASFKANKKVYEKAAAARGTRWASSRMVVRDLPAWLRLKACWMRLRSHMNAEHSN